MARLLIAGDDGLRELASDGTPGPIHHAGRKVTAVAREGWELWAVVDDQEVWHTAGVDRWVHVVNLSGLRAGCIADTRAGVVIGTSEARLFRVAGEGLEPLDGFDKVDGRSDWYTPWGGPPDSRSISEDDENVYVNVHVGGIVRSGDQGRRWEPTIDIHADVHRVWAAEGWVLAACARGLAVSEDRGESWNVRADGLDASYCRSVALCGDMLLVSASTGPGGKRSALHRAPVGVERPFERCQGGLPEWFDDNIDSYCLDSLDGSGELAAFGTSDGRVFTSVDQGASWSEVASGLPPVRGVLLAPS